MEIIIEYVLIDNLVINFLILYITAFALKLTFKKWRFFLADIFGTMLAIVFPLLNLHFALLLLLKILTGVLMVLIAFKVEKFKHFFVLFFSFILSTALFGGITFLIYYFIFGSLNLEMCLSNSYNFPLGIIWLGLSLFVLFNKKIISLIIAKQKSRKFLYKIEFQTKSKKIRATAYLDSGHKLFDPTDNLPVIIINYNLFCKLYKIPIENILLKNVSKELKNAHYIKISTLNSGSNEMLIFEVDEIRLQNECGKYLKKKANLGLSLTNFSKSFNCDVLISPDVLWGDDA